MNPIKHVAIIMDGNGRWGLKHKSSRNAGHRAGLNTVEVIIKESIKSKIQYLTLYTFSTENWKRPKKEINFLFNLLEDFLFEKIDNLIKNGIKLKIMGNQRLFTNKLKKLLGWNSLIKSYFALIIKIILNLKYYEVTNHKY